ncbi:MAG TPA: CPBP family intramembrane glutamic endopeptidase [Egibacteraceae bacterium]
MQRPRRAVRWRPSALLGEELAAWLLVTGHHLLVHRAAPPPAHAALNVGAAGLTLALARAAGLGAADLGLDRRSVLPGVRLGALVGAGVGGAVALGARAASDETIADDRAAGHSRRRAAGEVLVRIPFATALTEELVHRGALLGLLRQRLAPRDAALASSLAFGLAHVLPAFDAVASTGAGRNAAGRRGGTPAAVLGTVATTTLAGVGFAWLRERSGSVLAPAIVHAVANATGFVVARRAARA